MKIRLTDGLDVELRIIGLKPGDVLEVPEPNSKNGCIHFQKDHNNWTFNCSIWPDSYEKINQ